MNGMKCFVLLFVCHIDIDDETMEEGTIVPSPHSSPSPSSLFYCFVYLNECYDNDLTLLKIDRLRFGAQQQAPS